MMRYNVLILLKFIHDVRPPIQEALGWGMRMRGILSLVIK